MRNNDLAEVGSVTETDGATLGALMRRYECDIIRQALITARGSVTRAALSLGVSHQRLVYILNSRHRDLLSVRTPAEPRKRRVIA
jgi:transcriptional regulator with PAS, ATPase and Fis domain